MLFEKTSWFYIFEIIERGFMFRFYYIMMLAVVWNAVFFVLSGLIYYSDDEMEAMIATEEGNLNEDVKKGVLTTLLVAAGIEIVAGG